MSEIDGVVKFGGIVKGRRKVLIVPSRRPNRASTRSAACTSASRRASPSARASRSWTGPQSARHPGGPRREELQRYLVNEIQEVYRLQA